MSRAVVLLGGGAAGAVLTQSDVAKEELAKWLSIGGAAAGSTTSTSASLMTQVNELSKQLGDLRYMALNRETVTVVQSGAASALGVVPTMGTLVVAGAAASGYMWLKGYHWDDMFYVTRAKLEQATAGLTERLSVLGDALRDATTALNEKLGLTEQELKDNIGVMQLSLEGEIQGTRGEVLGVRDQVGNVQRALEDVSGQVEGAFGRLDYTSRGIHLLCNVLADSMEINTPSMRQLRDFVQHDPALIIENGSSNSRRAIADSDRRIEEISDGGEPAGEISDRNALQARPMSATFPPRTSADDMTTLSRPHSATFPVTQLISEPTTLTMEASSSSTSTFSSILRTGSRILQPFVPME